MSVALRVVSAIALIAVSWPAFAEGHIGDVEAWRSSPFHGQRDGGTGLPIPCTCRFNGRDFRVGERVCMSTPQAGIVIARCDLVNNVTSWVPTTLGCVISQFGGMSSARLQ